MNSMIERGLDFASNFSSKAPPHWGTKRFLLFIDNRQKPRSSPIKWRFQLKAANSNSRCRSRSSNAVANHIATRNRLATASIVQCAAAFAMFASLAAHAAATDLRPQLREHLKNPEFTLDRKSE